MTEYERFKNQTLKLLGDIISEEAAKSDGAADLDLIEACESLMCTLLEGSETLTEREIRARVRKITRTQRRPASVLRPRGYVSRAAAILCAVLLLCISVCAVCVMHLAIRKSITDAIGGDPDVPMIRCERGDTVAEYRTMETLMVAQELDFMYPHLLPEDVRIARFVAASEEPFSAQIYFSGQAGHVCIEASGMPSDITEAQDAQIVQFGERWFMIWQGRVWWHALTSDDRYNYLITYSDEAGLFTVMEGFYSGINKEGTLPAWAEAPVISCTGCGNIDLEMKHGFTEEETDRAYCTVSHHYHCIWTCGNCGTEGTVSHSENGINHRYHCYERENGYMMQCIDCGYEFPLK